MHGRPSYVSDIVWNRFLKDMKTEEGKEERVPQSSKTCETCGRHDLTIASQCRVSSINCVNSRSKPEWKSIEEWREVPRV